MPPGRRTTLRDLGLTTAAVREPGGLLGEITRVGRGRFTLALQPITVVRPADLLCLRFSFANLTVGTDAAGSPVLRRFADGHPARLVVDFPPQHLVEEAFFQSTTQTDPTHRPVKALLSAHSRLVYTVGDSSVPFTLEGLLGAMSTLPLNVAPHAIRPKTFSRTFVADAPAVSIAAIGALSRTASASTVVAHSIARSRALVSATALERRFGSAEAQLTAAGWSITETLGLGDLVAEVSPHVFELLTRRAPREPTSTETAIELPWRLLLSPSDLGGFAHAPSPVEHDGRTELWHSRLGARTVSGEDVEVDERNRRGRMVRAVWARDFAQFPQAAQEDGKGAFPSTDSPPWRKALSAGHRMKIVHETSNARMKTFSGRFWDPEPIDVDRLMLTTLGGWLSTDLEVGALPEGNLDIAEWKHRATLGRDHYVKVSEVGFLFPFGHKAVLVTVTERKFTPGEPGNPAYLYQRQFIAVLERTRSYTSSATYQDSRTYGPAAHPKRLDLSMPFASVSVLTRVTPDLDKGGDLLADGSLDFSGSQVSSRVMFPHVAGRAFDFALLATDREGNSVEYAGPLLFVGRPANTLDPAQAWDLSRVTKAYWKSADPLRRHHTRGARIAFAPTIAQDGTPLDTTVETASMVFDAATDGSLANRPQDEPRFAPLLREASVVVPSVSVVAKQSDALTVTVPAHYAAQGLAGNAAHVFLEAVTPPALDFTSQADRSGGFVTPSMVIRGLSGSTGPIGCAVEKAVSGSLTPADFFGAIDAKLFGAVSLVDLIEAIAPGSFPRFIADSLDSVAALQRDLARVTDLADTLGTRVAAADAQGQAVLTAVQGVATAAGALVTAIAGFSPGDQLSDEVDALADSLGGVADAVAAAGTIPAAIRTEVGAVVKRLEDAVADAAGVIALIEQVAGGLQLPETVRARLSWSTQLQPVPAGMPVFQPVPAPGQSLGAARSTLDLVVEVTAPVTSGGEPTASVACSLSPFRLQLVGEDPWIALHIEKIEFVMVTGRKADVDIVFDEDDAVVFGGPLGFVNTLRDFIPFDGFSDPPYLDVDTSGIRAGFDLELPPITVGVMSLTRVSLGAEVRVPFIGESLDFTFTFCTRERPFLLTVWLFGGGGFFAITVTPEGCKTLEASFEFGAAVALDFGVASGSVEVMAGIYFRLESGNSQLTGYFRLRGEVDVLGLISACIELYLELTYEIDTGKAVGRAVLTVEVEVLFFSASVQIECEKKFKGSNQDPTFAQVMGPAPGGAVRPWDDYCAAFAAA